MTTVVLVAECDKYFEDETLRCNGVTQFPVCFGSENKKVKHSSDDKMKTEMVQQYT